MLVGGLAFVFAYSTLGLYFLDREFVHPISFPQALKRQPAPHVHRAGDRGGAEDQAR